MKQTFITTLVFLFLGINFLFAAEADKEKVNENEKIEVAYEQQVENEPIKAQEFVKSENEKSFKRIFKIRSKRLMEKLGINKLLNPQKKGLALAIIGFIIFLPGMILSLVGVALIPAIILTVVGGILWIMGILRMR